MSPNKMINKLKEDHPAIQLVEFLTELVRRGEGGAYHKPLCGDGVCGGIQRTSRGAGPL